MAYQRHKGEGPDTLDAWDEAEAVVRGLWNRNSWSEAEQVDELRWLLERGADAIDAEELDYLLNFAADKGRLDLVDVILEYGGDPNFHSPEVRSSLMLASKRGYCAVVRRLLKAGANPYTVHVDGLTAVHMAVDHGHVDVVHALLEEGVDVGLRYSGGHTLLHAAALHSNLSLTRLLLECGASVGAFTIPSRQTPLHFAAESGMHEQVSLLLQHGADATAVAESADISSSAFGVVLHMVTDTRSGAVVCASQQLLYPGACDYLKTLTKLRAQMAWLRRRHAVNWYYANW